MTAGLAAACANWSKVFVDAQHIFFVDADCYSRMTRVRVVGERPGTILAAHDFENYPFGTRPHTTALLDYGIWGLRGVLRVFTHTDARDLAGAWVSPLLGLVAFAALGFWSNRLRLPGRLPMWLVFAASPIIAHCFSLGRPDHQSLALACMAWALVAECALWTDPTKGWGVASGVAWALGLWTTLYEPVVLLVLVVGAGAIFNRPALLIRERLPGLAAGGVILLIALAIEGWRVDALPGFGGGGGAPFFAAWARQIGELQSVAPWDGIIWRWSGWGLALAPILLGLPRKGSPVARLHLILLLAVWALTCWQLRWGYFLPLVYALSLPAQLSAIPQRWRAAAAGVIVLLLFPVFLNWRQEFKSTPGATAAAAEARDDNLQLHVVADFIARFVAGNPRDANTRGILAPWWQSPALAYWSGQPALAGSSHEALPGTVDTARFYLETDSRAALDLLKERHVRWVVAYEPDRAVRNSAQLFDRSMVPARCLGNVLYQRPALAPGFLRLAMASPYFKVYEVAP